MLSTKLIDGVLDSMCRLDSISREVGISDATLPVRNVLRAVRIINGWHKRGLIDFDANDDTFKVLSRIFKVPNDTSYITDLYQLRELIPQLEGPYGWAIYKAWLAKQEGK